jgi:hypothetical protein
MSALTVAAVRQRVEAALVAEAGFTKSRFHPDLFGLDARLLMHGAFAVGAPLTEAHPTTQRQRLTEGVLANTTISVRLAANHRADNQVADFDSLLGLESTLIKTVEGIARTDLHIVFESAAREPTTEFEFLLSTVTFRAIHRLALQ